MTGNDFPNYTFIQFCTILTPFSASLTLMSPGITRSSLKRTGTAQHWCLPVMVCLWMSQSESDSLCFCFKSVLPLRKGRWWNIWKVVWLYISGTSALPAWFVLHRDTIKHLLSLLMPLGHVSGLNVFIACKYCIQNGKTSHLLPPIPNWVTLREKQLWYTAFL